MTERQPTERRPAKRGSRKPPGSFTLSTTWALALLVLLGLVFFHEVALEGKTFVSPDTQAPVGFVRVGEQSLWKDHVYPTWNPYVFLGMPSFASGAYNPLIYPPDWPLALVQKVLPLPDMTWLLIYYVVGGLGMFLLAREWGARPEGALLGAAAFMFAPNLVAVGSHGHGSQLVDSAWAPVMLWLAVRWLARGRLTDLGFLALAGGFQLLRGHVQICFYTWLAIGLWTLVAWITGLARAETRVSITARALGIGAAAALAFGLAGFYNLPLRDYAQHSIRGGGDDGGVGMEYATQWSLAMRELPSILVPGWAGFGNPTYWGAMPFTDYPNAYLGTVAVLLALPAFLARGPQRVFVLGLAVLALLIAFGKHTPVYGFLYDHFPLFNKFRIPVMVVLLLQIAAGIGLAWGWSAVLDEAKGAHRGRGLGRLLFAVAAVTALVFVVGVMGQDAWRQPYIDLAVRTKGIVLGFGRDTFSSELAAQAYQGFVSDLGRACLLGLLAVGAALLVRRGTLAPAVGSAAVLVLLLVELWPVSGRVMAPVIGPTVAHTLDAGRDDVVQFLEQAGPPGTFRIFPVDEFQSNRFAGFAISSVGGYHAAKTRLFQDLYDTRKLASLPWLRLLNVRFIVARQDFPPAAGITEAYRGPGGIVFENAFALPRATVVGEVRVVTPAKAIIDTIAGGRDDGARVAFMDRDPGFALGPVDGARAEIASYGLHDVVVDVDTPGPGLLRLADLWYPEWRATVNGTPAEILRVDYLLRGVPVPAGKSRVEFHYRSAVIARGLTVSLVSLAVILALLGFGWWRSRPAKAVAPAPREA
jgi:hypothetical protein